MPEKLFVYGTLHPKTAPRELADLVCRFKPLGQGTVHGRVYDFGEYPGIVLDRNADAVMGEVFAIPMDGDAMARLDAYEEYSPKSPGESLFLRQKTKVTLADGSEPECWVYVYNRSLRGHRRQQLASVA